MAYPSGIGQDNRCAGGEGRHDWEGPGDETRRIGVKERRWAWVLTTR